MLRGSLLVVAVLLLLGVGWEIWSNRPRRKRAAPAPIEQPANAKQTLEKFEYTATELGKLAYRIVADRLVGVEGGLHTVQGIRSAEITLADGRVLRARADRGMFTTGATGEEGGAGASGEDGGLPAAGNAHVVLEGNVIRVERCRRESRERPHRLLPGGVDPRLAGEVPLPARAVGEHAGRDRTLAGRGGKRDVRARRRGSSGCRTASS